MLIVAAVFGGVAYFVDWFGLLSLGLILLSTWALLLGVPVLLVWYLLHRIGFLRLVPSKSLVYWPGLVAMLGLAGVIGSIVGAPIAVLPSDGASVQEQLAHLLETDQRDRISGRFAILPWRDKNRLERTRSIVESAGDSLDAESKYAAAMVLQHGDRPRDFEMAHTLALAAFESGYKDAEFLVRAAYDRWQISLGKPQKYGTQSSVRIGITGIQSSDPAGR
jgi:hypothetical protein